MPERRRALRSALTLAIAALLGATGLGLSGSAAASAYPPLPLGFGAILMGNLSAPTLTPGASGSIGFSVVNPLANTIVGAVATLDVYAFNAFPGNATSTVPVAGAPILTNATASGPSVTVAIGGLTPGAKFLGSIGVTSSGSTPVGAFAVRTELTFTSGGTAYRLASRGWFTAAEWDAATELPNGSATLNLSQLGVSGVIPETAVIVTTSIFPWVLGAVVAAGIGFIGLGAWLYFRRESSSRSGTRKGDADQ